MTNHLPVPAPRHLSTLPGEGLAASASASGWSAHRRRPRLDRVTCLSYGAGLLAAAGGRVCCVWDTRTHELIARLVLGSPIGAVWVERAAGRWLTLACGPAVMVFDLPAGTLKYTYQHHAEVTSVHIANGTNVAGSVDVRGQVEVHDLGAGHLVQRLDTPPGWPRVFLDRGRYALVDSGTHSAFYDVATGALRRRFPYDPLEGLDLDGMLFGSTLVSPSGRWLRWFDCSKHAHAHCVHDLGSAIQSIDLDSEHDLALAATVAGRISLFDLGSGQPRANYHSFTVPLLFARFGADASIYAAGGEALVMHLVQGQHVRSYYDEAPPLVAMAMTQDAEHVLLSNRDGGVAAVSLREGRRVASLDGHHGSVSVVSCFGTRVATGAYDGTVRVFELPSAQPKMVVNLQQGPVQSALADVQARRLWVGTWAGRVNEVSLDTGRLGASIKALPSSVRSLAIDSQRGLLCAGGDEGELRLLNVASDQPQPLAAGLQSGTPFRVLFDADGTLLVTAEDGLRRYEPTTMKVLARYPGRAIRWFDRSAGRVACLSLHGELTLYDEATHELRQRAMIDSPFNHRSVAFLGANRILVASADGLMRVFDERLQWIATLELLRDGFLWHTAPQDNGHPGWLHTDRSDLLDVGERAPGGDLLSWAATDPRRARHLAKWTSASHVMQNVRGDAPMLPLATGRVASALALAPIGHRLGWSR